MQQQQYSSALCVLLRTLALVLALASAAGAHEFWLEPVRFHSAGNRATPVRIQVGENFSGDGWKGSGRRIRNLRDYSHGQSRPLPLQGATFQLPAGPPGQHLVTFSNDNSYIQLEGQKFNQYLRDDGLDNALQWRQDHGQENRPGREFYRRCVKTLMQLGPPADDDATYALNTGLPLELIPARNPYAASGPAEMRFSVLFQQKPQANALVQVWHRGDGRTTRQQLRSDAQGEVAFPMWREGTWMVSTVHMERVAPGQKADWQSYWSSYTFGF